MKNLVVLLAFGATLVACQTQGVIESRYDGQNGSSVRLQQFNQDGRFFYSISASLPDDAPPADGDAATRVCGPRELKLVAMGAGGKIALRLERQPRSACES